MAVLVIGRCADADIVVLTRRIIRDLRPRVCHLAKCNTKSDVGHKNCLGGIARHKVDVDGSKAGRGSGAILANCPSDCARLTCVPCSHTPRLFARKIHAVS